MYTLDASVWISAFEERELNSEASRQVLLHFAKHHTSIVQPNLVLVEVAAVISRVRNDHAVARVFATYLRQMTNVTLLPLDENLCDQAIIMATTYRLRGADAIYAAIAMQTGSILISLDNEHLTRLNSVIPVYTPASIIPLL